MSSELLERTNASLDFIYRRHSVRAYTAEEPDEPLIRRLLDAAVHAPTAMHQEPWRFVVVQDRALLGRWSEQAKEMARRESAHHGKLLKPPGAAGEGAPSPLANPDFNIFYDAGTLILVCAVPSNDFVTADCWLAAENLMLAASAEGLGTCCIGFALPLLNTDALRTELGVGHDLRVFAAVIAGTPRGRVMPTPRRTAVVLKWIRGGGMEDLASRSRLSDSP
jgi:nitroreductase